MCLKYTKKSTIQSNLNKLERKAFFGQLWGCILGTIFSLNLNSFIFKNSDFNPDFRSENFN